MFYNMTWLERILFLKRIKGSGNPMHEATSYTGSFVTDVVAPLKSLKVTLEPIQSGSGTPSPDNVRPISGHTECVTEVCGKNLLDPQSITVGKFYNNTLTEITNADKAHSNFIKIKPSTSYCLNGFAGQSFYSMLALDANKQPITTWYSGSSKTAPFVATTPSNAYYMVLNFNADQVSTIAFYESATVDGYIPYDGTTYTTDLGRTVYGGTLDVVSGELVVDRAMVDLGTREWSRYDPSGTNIPVFYASVQNAKIATIPICSAYKCESWSSLSSRTNGTLQMHPTLALAYVADDRFTDATDFITAVSGVQLCYELANPQTYQLTRQQINSLIGQNNIITDDGVEVDEIVYMTRLVGSPLLGSPQAEEAEEPTEETDEPIEESEEPEGE